jgi:hypothetical protein
MLRVLNSDAKSVMELSGHTSYESFQIYSYTDEATTEKARDVIKWRGGNLTGNEVSVATGVAQSPALVSGKKRPLAPAVKVKLDKSGE